MDQFDAVELLLHHDGDDRCGCLSLIIMDILLDVPDGPDAVGEVVAEIPQRIRDCYIEHAAAWDRQGVAETMLREQSE